MRKGKCFISAWTQKELRTMADSRQSDYPRRVYPLDARQLTEEQIAVAFAMTSRRPEAFDAIAQQVSEEKAADFHERWVLGYGHASVAEHAVLHLAVENISRIACDTLEDNRLASYTEKSSRYQVFPEGYYHVPRELDRHPALSKLYRETCDSLFQDYQRCIDGCMEYLRTQHPQQEKERTTAYDLRLRRIATDSCRLLLPAASLTNVGVTANARVLEHAISKLLSSDLKEERELGQEVRERSRSITPTLIKYADVVPYFTQTSRKQREISKNGITEADAPNDPAQASELSLVSSPVRVRLVDWEEQAEEKLAAALVYRYSSSSYAQVWQQITQMDAEERQGIIARCTASLGPHDAPVREFELVGYTFEFSMDYGAYREFKRHRMMSYVPQPLTVAHGYRVPQVIVDAGLDELFQGGMTRVEQAHGQVASASPLAAQYLVTHAHYRRILARMNLRECYHLFQLRTSELAHFSIREPMLEAMKLVVDIQPQLFRHLRLRDYPEWWPFPRD